MQVVAEIVGVNPKKRDSFVVHTLGSANYLRVADKPLAIGVPKDGRVQLTVAEELPSNCHMTCSAVRERIGTHRTFTLGSTDSPGFSNPSTLNF
jgi:hypothetical protein